jgi:hypothetical protein
MKPFADPVIEAVFANEAVAGLAMRSFINAVLTHTGDRPIGEVVRLTPQKTVPNVLARGYRLDLDARSGDGSIADTEVQFRKMDMNNRAFLTGGRLIGEQAEKGQRLETVLAQMPRVIVINVCLFGLRGTHKGFHQPVELAYRLPDEETGGYERASDRLEIHNLELPKFEKHILPELTGKSYSGSEPKIHYWLWAMWKSQRESITMKEVIQMEPALKSFAETDAGFAQYTERYEDISRDDRIRLQYAMWTEGMSALDQARFEGKSEGIAEGEARGEVKGITKGHNEMFDAFRKLGVSPEILAKAKSEIG